MEPAKPAAYGSANELREKAESWLSREGSEAIARAFKQAESASQKFRDAALVRPEDLNKPMTV